MQSPSKSKLDPMKDEFIPNVPIQSGNDEPQVEVTFDFDSEISKFHTTGMKGSSPNGVTTTEGMDYHYVRDQVNREVQSERIEKMRRKGWQPCTDPDVKATFGRNEEGLPPQVEGSGERYTLYQRPAAITTQERNFRKAQTEGKLKAHQRNANVKSSGKLLIRRGK